MVKGRVAAAVRTYPGRRGEAPASASGAEVAGRTPESDSGQHFFCLPWRQTGYKLQLRVEGESDLWPHVNCAHESRAVMATKLILTSSSPQRLS